jgi:hypothetical protein
VVGNIEGDGDYDDDAGCLERKNRESCEQCGAQKRNSGTAEKMTTVHQREFSGRQTGFAQ